MTYQTCPRCGAFGNSTHHKCAPIWSWRSDNHGPDEWSEVHARDAEGAAEIAAEHSDRDDYALLRGNEIIITVRSPDGVVSRWACTGESVPSYSATEVDEDET